MRPKTKVIIVSPSTVDGKTVVKIKPVLPAGSAPDFGTRHHPVSRWSILRLERLMNSEKCNTRPMIFEDAVWLYGHWKGESHEKNN